VGNEMTFQRGLGNGDLEMVNLRIPRWRVIPENPKPRNQETGKGSPFSLRRISSSGVKPVTSAA